MSSSGIHDLRTVLNGGQPAPATKSATAAADADNASFAAAFALRLAEFRSQTLGSLVSASSSGLAGTGSLQQTPGAVTDPAGFLSAPGAPGGVAGLSPTGRNMALFDPESAYRMMSVINKREVEYKAQHSELSAMRTEVASMQREGAALAGFAASTDTAEVKARLQDFVARYNDWIGRFDAAVRAGGVLAGTQAAEVSRHELRASIENPFIGANHGLHGMRDLGIEIDPQSRQASFDPARFDAALNRNPAGVIGAMQEFGSHFARSAELLNSEGNFIPNRLRNLDRAIDYIGDQRPALQAEFGLGDPARPPGQVAAALAAYQANLAA